MSVRGSYTEDEPRIPTDNQIYLGDDNEIQKKSLENFFVPSLFCLSCENLLALSLIS